MKNRHARRAAAARARKMQRHDAWYQGDVKHLPQVPLDAPYERGRLYHMCFHHDHWCAFYDTESMADCNCDPIVTRHVEPERS